MGNKKSRMDNYTHTTSIRTIYPYNYIRLIIAQWQQKHLENSTKLYKKPSAEETCRVL
jgi:hypothetical protein